MRHLSGACGGRREETVPGQRSRLIATVRMSVATTCSYRDHQYLFVTTVRRRTDPRRNGAHSLCSWYSEDNFMNIIIWLVVGGLIGWAASTVMRTREGILLNVVVGIVGAALGGWLLSPFFGASTINQGNFSVAGLLVSLVGAVILLAIVNLVRRGVPR